MSLLHEDAVLADDIGKPVPKQDQDPYGLLARALDNQDWLVDLEGLKSANDHAMLETLGYEVIEARDGLEAVEIFRRRAAEIDLVILDLVMPRLTGEAALGQMRRIAPAVPAILVSGYDESGRIREIVAAGFGGFLQKPFRRQDLGRKVREILGLSRGSAAE